MPVPQADPLGRERRGEQRQERVVGGLVGPQAVDPQPLVRGRLAAERMQVMAAQAYVDLHGTLPFAAPDYVALALAMWPVRGQAHA